MRLCVLHLSDLHRDSENPISNQVLLDSLERDRDRYTKQGDPVIQSPDLIVISGDIVQGVGHESDNPKANLQQQYDEALAFLNELTARFISSDKRRLIVVPGNHDVSDPHFRQSLAPVHVTTDTRQALSEQLFTPGSRLRWSWREFALYRIADSTIYGRRFDAFVDFYSRLYEGKRQYSTDPAKQFDIFDFPDWGLTVVGFSSCSDNDPLNKQGSIHPDCIAEAGNQLRGPLYHNRLRMAVWHHGIEGPPPMVDYMDPDIVQNLIDGGYSLGFHGHQHRPQYLDARFRYHSDRRIAVVSAGTVCGSTAYRFARAYNLIELDTEARRGLLHVREMLNEDLRSPIWGPRFMPINSSHYLDFQFDPPIEPFVSTNQNTALLVRARHLYESSEYREASSILAQLSPSERLARPLLLDCLEQLNDTAGIIAAFDPPVSAAEAIALMDSLWVEKSRERLAAVLRSLFIKESGDPSIVEIREKYIARLGK